MTSAIKTWWCWLLALTLAMLALGPAVGGLYPRPPELERLIGELLQNNEELQSLAEERTALEAEVSVAGALDDPRLGIGLANVPTDTFSFNQEPMTQKQLFIAQKLPWFGKLDLRTQLAVVAVERQRALIEARRLELIRSLSEAFYELGFVAESLRVNAELVQTVEQMLQVAEAAYASGSGLQQDVFQAQVELGRLVDEQVSLGKRREVQVARVNELLGKPDFVAVAAPADLAFPETTLDPEKVRQWALAYHPMLRVRQADIDRSAVNIELARKNYYPDMDVSVAYGQREEDLNGRSLPDFLSASVVVNLPLWQRQKQDKQLDAAQNRRKAAEKSYENLLLALPHQVTALTSELDAVRENYRLFSGGLLEQTRNWSLAALSAYEVGKLDFDTMIAANMRALRFVIQTERYIFQYYQKLAALEALAGITLIEPPGAATALPGESQTVGQIGVSSNRAEKHQE